MKITFCGRSDFWRWIFNVRKQTFSTIITIFGFHFKIENEKGE